MSTKKKKQKKHRAVLPYFVKPAVYVLFSLILVIPISLVALHYAVNFVHKAQPSFAFSVADIELNKDAYSQNGTTSGTVKRPEIKAGDKVAELVCEDAGLKCDVYFGRNRVSFREGAGMLTDILPGEVGVCELYGNRATAFSPLKNAAVGDKIYLNTSWGSFVYSVSSVTLDTQPPDDTMPQSLLLVCENDEKVYSNFNEEKLFVLADIEAGPQLEEVQE